MIELTAQASTSRTPQQRNVLKRQIAATDRQIDELVYQLYELTDDEIRIVEEATATKNEATEEFGLDETG